MDTRRRARSRPFRLHVSTRLSRLIGMFCVDEPTAEAIRRVFHEDGELSAVIELRRHFPLITDIARGRECVRAIAGWRPLPSSTKPESDVVTLKPRRRPKP